MKNVWIKQMQTFVNNNRQVVGDTPINFKELQEDLQDWVQDRRYKVLRRAETSTSGIFTFLGVKYYWCKEYRDNDYDYINVEVCK